MAGLSRTFREGLAELFAARKAGGGCLLKRLGVASEVWLRIGWLCGCFLVPAGRASAQESPKSAVEYARDLESSDRNLRREAAYQLSRMGRGAKVALPQLVKALEDEQQQVWFGAITALANLGPDGEPALPALLTELEGWQPFRRDRQGNQGLYRTALALGSIGSAAVPALSNALASDKWHVRAGAARALGFAKEPALPVVPRLLGILADERQEVRDASAETLAILGPGAVPQLVEALRLMEEPRAKAAASLSLERLGKSASSAVPALVDALGREKDPSVRSALLSALGRVSQDATLALPILLKAWEDSEPVVQKAARSALLLLRPVEGVLLPVIIPQLASADPVVRTRAARLVADLGPDASGAATALVAAIRERAAMGLSDPESVRALAATGEAGLSLVFDELRERPLTRLDTNDWALAVLRQSDIGVLSPLSRAMTNASPLIRAGALEGLVALGDRARSVAKALPPLLDDAESAVRSRAWLAAGACGVAPELLMGRLEKGLSDPSIEVRRAVMQGLARLGKAARPAIPRIIESLNSEDALLELAAIRSLGSMGVEAEEAVPTLAAKLGRTKPETQVEILGALGAIGAGAASELPLILAVGASEEVSVRMALLEAMVRFRDKGSGGLPLIERALVDKEPGVRAVAVRARVAVEPESELSLKVAIAGLDDREAVVRKAAAAALGQLEERGRPAEAKLFAMLSNPEDRPAAKEALRSIHPTSIPALLEALSHPEWGVREMAADALARLGKGATEAVPALEKAVRDDSADEVKRASRRALRRIREG